MMRDPKVESFAREFFGQWLRYRDYLSTDPIPAGTFPGYDAALRQAMFEEPTRLITHLIREDQTVDELLHSDATFVSSETSSPSSTAARSRPSSAVSGPRTWRASRSGRPRRSEEEVTWPSSRGDAEHRPGRAVRDAGDPVEELGGAADQPGQARLLGRASSCSATALPAAAGRRADVAEVRKGEREDDPRDAHGQHTTQQQCAMCHVHFDGLGAPTMEGFDAVGRARTKDLAGRKLEAVGPLPGGKSADGVSGLIDYVEKNRMPGVRAYTFCRKVLGYASGSFQCSGHRDQPLLEEMENKLHAEGGVSSVLFEAVVTESAVSSATRSRLRSQRLGSGLALWNSPEFRWRKGTRNSGEFRYDDWCWKACQGAFDEFQRHLPPVGSEGHRRHRGSSVARIARRQGRGCSRGRSPAQAIRLHVLRRRHSSAGMVVARRRGEPGTRPRVRVAGTGQGQGELHPWPPRHGETSVAEPRHAKGPPASSAGIIRAAAEKFLAAASLDQLLSTDASATATALPSLVAWPANSLISGFHESGYSMMYASHVSWSSPVSPVPAELYPSLAFDSLFESRNRTSASVLDHVNEQLRDVTRNALPRRPGPDRRIREQHPRGQEIPGWPGCKRTRGPVPARPSKRSVPRTACRLGSRHAATRLAMCDVSSPWRSRPTVRGSPRCCSPTTCRDRRIPSSA